VRRYIALSIMSLYGGFDRSSGARRSDSTPKSWRKRRTVTNDSRDLQTWNPRVQLSSEMLRNTRSTVLSNAMFVGVDENTNDNNEEMGAVVPFNIVTDEKTDTGFVSNLVIPTATYRFFCTSLR
jgi:hypothetical protein